MTKTNNTATETSMTTPRNLTELLATLDNDADFQELADAQAEADLESMFADADLFENTYGAGY